MASQGFSLNTGGMEEKVFRPDGIGHELPSYDKRAHEISEEKGGADRRKSSIVNAEVLTGEIYDERFESTKRGLKSRHAQMIALGGRKFKRRTGHDIDELVQGQLEQVFSSVPVRRSLGVVQRSSSQHISQWQDLCGASSRPSQKWRRGYQPEAPA